MIAAEDGKKDIGTLQASQLLTRVVAPHDVALFRLDAVERREVRFRRNTLEE